MPKTYAVRFTIDDTSAVAAMKRGVKGAEAVEAAWARAAGAMEKAQASAGNAIAAAVQKRAAAEVQTAKRTADTRINEEERVARAVEKINDRANMIVHRQLARQRAFELGPNGRLGMQARGTLDPAVIQQAALNRAMDVTHKKMVDARLAQMGLNDSFSEGIAQGIGLTGAATKAGLALMGVAAAKTGIDAVAAAMFQARKNSEDMATGVLDFMVKLRPLASVMGERPGRAFAEKVAGFAVTTGKGKEEAAAFLESFYGAANLAKGVNISGPEFEKFAVGAGKLSTARGIPGPQAAELGAAVVKLENFQAKGQGAKEALTRMQGLFDILDAGKGLIPQLAPAATRLIATLASESELEGVFRSAGEAGVVTSLMAEAHPEDPDVFARAGVKALSRFRDKKRQPFYKRAGIVPGMSAIERFQRANQVFEEEVAKGKPLEKVFSEFNLDTDVREQQALQAAFQARKTTFPKQMARMRSFQGPQAAAATEAFIAGRFGEEDVRFTAGAAAVEKSKLKAESIPLKLAKQQAEAELIKEGLDTTFTGLLGQSMGTAFSLFQKPGRESMIEARAIRNMQIQAGEAPGVTGAQAIFGGNAAEIERLTKAIEANTKAQMGQAGPMGGAAAPRLLGAPNARPIRP